MREVFGELKISWEQKYFFSTAPFHIILTSNIYSLFKL